MQPRLFASRCVRLLTEVVPRWTGLQHESDVVAGQSGSGWARIKRDRAWESEVLRGIELAVARIQILDDRTICDGRDAYGAVAGFVTKLVDGAK